MRKDAPPRPPTHRCGYIPWHVLMRRGLNLDIEACPRCGGKMRLVALVQEPENIARYLRHLGLPTEVPALAAARGPPFWQSRVLRPLRGLGPARPAPAARGFAAPVAAATECLPTRLKRSRSSPLPLRSSLAYPSARHWGPGIHFGRGME